MTKHNHTDAPSSTNQSFSEQKKEQLRYLRENPPKFKKKTWTYGRKKLSACYHIATNCVETTNMLINYDLPLDSSPEDFVFLEIYDTKTRKAVHVRVKSIHVQYTHELVDMKRKFQEYLYSYLHPSDMRLPNPERAQELIQEFLTTFPFATWRDTYENFEDAKQHLEDEFYQVLSIAKLLYKPVDLDQTFFHTYDLKVIEEGKTVPGAFLSISYKHMDKNGTPNVKPWKIKISNYTLTHSIPHPSKTNVAEQFVTLSDDEYRTLCDYINDENTRWFEYMIEWNYWIAKNQ